MKDDSTIEKVYDHDGAVIVLARLQDKLRAAGEELRRQKNQQRLALAAQQQWTAAQLVEHHESANEDTLDRLLAREEEIGAEIQRTEAAERRLRVVLERVAEALALAGRRVVFNRPGNIH